MLLILASVNLYKQLSPNDKCDDKNDEKSRYNRNTFLFQDQMNCVNHIAVKLNSHTKYVRFCILRRI